MLRTELDSFRRFADLSADPRVRAMLEAFSPEVALARLLYARGERGEVDPRIAALSPEIILELMRENASPDAFEGKFVTRLRDGAMLALKRAGVDMPPVRVGLIESLEVNACARVLSGERVVTLNFAVVFHMLSWWRGLTAIYTAAGPQPYCRCFSTHEYAVSLLRLSQAIAAGSLDPLEHGGILDCDCRQPWDATLARNATTTELFVLLHEMGHIHLNHLERELSTRTNPYGDEYAADAFAVSVLMSAGMSVEEVLLGAGAFFTLAECLTRLPGVAQSATHPHPRDRLDRLLAAHWRLLEEIRPRPIAMMLGELSDVLGAQLAADFPEEFAGVAAPSNCSNAEWTRRATSHYVRG